MQVVYVLIYIDEVAVFTSLKELEKTWNTTYFKCEDKPELVIPCVGSEVMIGDMRLIAVYTNTDHL